MVRPGSRSSRALPPSLTRRSRRLIAAAVALGGLAAASATIIGNPTKAQCPSGGKVFTVGYDTFSDSQEFAAARWKGLQYWQKTLGCIKFTKLTDNADGTTALRT